MRIWFFDYSYGEGFSDVVDVDDVGVVQIRGDARLIQEHLHVGLVGGQLLVDALDHQLFFEPAQAELAREKDLAGVVLTTEVDAPAGYGRILRDGDSNVRGIVEERDATDEQIDALLIDNPRRFFAGEKLGARRRP